MTRIIFHFFYFYHAEMRRKLWPKAPAKEGALCQMSKNFKVYFIHINFSKKPNNKIYNRAKDRVILRCCYIYFWILYCLLTQKKWKLKNGPRPPTLFCRISSKFIYFHYFGRQYWIRCFEFLS